LSLFSFQGDDPLPDLHSFPTRRSSDLLRKPGGNDASRASAPRLGRHPVPRGRVPSSTRLKLLQRSERRASLGPGVGARPWWAVRDRKSTRLNSSHLGISYAVFCLKKKK